MFHNRIRKYLDRACLDSSPRTTQQAAAAFVWMRLDARAARFALPVNLYVIAFEQAEAKAKADFELWLSS